ncbi:response regulator transcription factor [Candidatus Nomurabacteria bacterium]|nr:response regulator transcription factor [Candidatus Kaiserbacteria bacterium]MCB9815362.1 response regulator transcription factor [Candidatus Nomurabacteria bacterium]MCB9819583.1 response regulator transcription factor [Candidatus Nomurabacteria bacterium]
MTDRKVLIIEDDEALRNLYSTILENADIKVLSASRGKEGVDMALKHHPDVILMDVMLPDFSGHDAMKKIRLDSWGKKATVIFLTNRSDAESIVNAVEKGSEEYIIKSHVSNKELLNKVRSVMFS